MTVTQSPQPALPSTGRSAPQISPEPRWFTPNAADPGPEYAGPEYAGPDLGPAGPAGPGDPPWSEAVGGTPAPGRPPARWPRLTVTGAAILALVVGGGAGGAALVDRLHPAPPAAASVPAVVAAATDTESLAAVAAAVTPSIVTVFVDGTESALGSGVILTADGLVLTNNHVIASGGTLSVGLSDGRTVPARLVAADATHDLALVQAAGVSGLTPATFGTDDSVAVGDRVLAFGSPLGLAGTVTAGIVSAVDRSVDTGGESLDHLLQTDAPINAGNSGGALVDTSGRVIGINVAIATTGQDSGSIGVGFAVPADTVTQVVAQLRADAG